MRAPTGKSTPILVRLQNPDLDGPRRMARWTHPTRGDPAAHAPRSRRVPIGQKIALAPGTHKTAAGLFGSHLPTAPL